jgi:uncharacterized membrane protein YeaQ/YmgE (transglycosylase-associated protein family)
MLRTVPSMGTNMHLPPEAAARTWRLGVRSPAGCISAPMWATRRRGDDYRMSVFVWIMIGVAIWHLAVLVPDRFYGGIIGAFLAAVAGALATGFLFPQPGVPHHNPPGLEEALWPIPGALIALVALYRYGVRREQDDL